MSAIIDGSVGSQFPTTIGVGGATPSTSGAGITFPATQSASSDANTLDDYEEGTWTSVLGGSTTDPTSVTYANQIGTYTKIGRMVTVFYNLAFTTYTGGSGDFRLKGLPFTATGSGIGTAIIESVTLTAGKTAVTTYLVSGNASARVFQYGSNTSYIDIPLTSMASSGTTKYLEGSFSYLAT